MIESENCGKEKERDTQRERLSKRERKRES